MAPYSVSPVRGLQVRVLFIGSSKYSCPKIAHLSKDYKIPNSGGAVALSAPPLATPLLTIVLTVLDQITILDFKLGPD